VTVVSTWLPARRASRISPMEALHESEATIGSLRSRGIAGGSVLGFGFLVLFTGLFTSVEPGPFSSILFVGLGAAVILIGVTILAPLVARPALKVIGRPFVAVFRVAGKIAQENARKTPRRTSATAGAIMIGVALVALASVMAASIRGTVDDLIDNGIQADLFVQAENQFSFTSFTPELAGRISADEAVTGTTTLRQGLAIVDESETFIAGIEDDFTEFITFDSLVGAFPLSRNGIALDKGSADDDDLALGAEVAMTFPDGQTETFVLEAIYESPGATGYAITQEAFAIHNPSVGDSQIYIQLGAGADLQAAQSRITALAADVPTVEILTLEELRSLAEDQIDQLLNLITGLLGLAVIISLFGVTNTMTLSVFERTHEIGLLRAVGMTRVQTRRMIRTEASIISVFGAVLGVIVGIFFAWAVVQALAEEGFDTFVVPFGNLAIWILLIGVLGVVFALLPAWRASKLNVLEAISYE